MTPEESYNAYWPLVVRCYQTWPNCNALVVGASRKTVAAWVFSGGKCLATRSNVQSLRACLDYAAELGKLTKSRNTYGYTRYAPMSLDVAKRPPSAQTIVDHLTNVNNELLRHYAFPTSR